MKRNSNKREIKRRLRALIPQVPLSDFLEIESLALAGHLRHLPPSIAVWQAVTTRIRHAHTDYDELLEEGYDPDSARHFVLDALNEKLVEWGCSEQIAETTDLLDLANRINTVSIGGNSTSKPHIPGSIKSKPRGNCEFTFRLRDLQKMAG